MSKAIEALSDPKTSQDMINWAWLSTAHFLPDHE